MVAIVVAYAANRTIGRDGQLPWRLPGDMRRFRELTSGHAVVMGRRTYESLPDAFRPLPRRRNLVLSRNPEYAPDGAEAFPDLDSAVEACGGECFVIGGAAVYREALRSADRIYATEVEQDFEGDTSFPLLQDEEWRCAERGETIVENGIPFAFVTYERVRKASGTPAQTRGRTADDVIRDSGSQGTMGSGEGST